MSFRILKDRSKPAYIDTVEVVLLHPCSDAVGGGYSVGAVGRGIVSAAKCRLNLPLISRKRVRRGRENVPPAF